MLQGRGLANLDFDNDGDQDILVFSFSDELRLYRNDLDVTARDANWLRVILDTSGSPDLAPNGFGAKVSTTVGGFSQFKHLDGGSNYLSQSELSVPGIFGWVICKIDGFKGLVRHAI